MSFDTGFALTLLAEELAHTLSTPIAFLRGLARQIETGGTLDPEDASILGEEAVRLRRLLTALRALRPPPLVDANVDVYGALERARLAHENAIASRALHFTVGVSAPAALHVRVDERALCFVLRVMVGALVLRATPGSSGRMAVSQDFMGTCIRIEVSVPLPLANDIFVAGQSSLSAFDSVHLDLAVARRMASAMGATLVQERIDRDNKSSTVADGEAHIALVCTVYPRRSST